MMEVTPAQNQSEEEILQQTVREDMSGFLSHTTVSHKTLMRIMKEDPKLQVYDGFTIGAMEKALDKIGFRNRKHQIIHRVTTGEFAIPMEFTGNLIEMQLVPIKEIQEIKSRVKREVANTLSWIHIGAIRVIIKATFKEGIDSPLNLAIFDKRISHLKDSCLGAVTGNLYAGKLAFNVYPRIAYNLGDRDFSRVLTLHQDFKRVDLMKEGNRPYSITYKISYALSNTHHSEVFLRKEFIEVPRIFEDFARVVLPEIIESPTIKEIDMIIQDQPVFNKSRSLRVEPRRMSFQQDRMVSSSRWEERRPSTVQRIPDVFKTAGELKCPEGWREVEVIFDITQKDNIFPCDVLYYLQQPIVGRYQGSLKIGEIELTITGVAGKIPEQLILGIEFLEEHKPWERLQDGMEFTVANKRYRIR